MTCAVLKADAYHLGAARVGKHLDGLADFFAVATAEEALALCGQVTKPVLLLNFPEPAEIPELVARKIRLTVFERDQLRALGAYPEAVVHLKFDSGMNRLGFRRTNEVLECLGAGVRTEGVFTHFFSEERTIRRYQTDRFSELVGECRKIAPGILAHVGGSGVSETRHGFDMTRTGIGLYRGAAVLKSRVISLKEVGEADYLSYGETLSGRARRIAAVSCGYADGVPRSLGNGKHCVKIRGTSCPVLGAVCMDMLLCDVTGTETEIGDEVIAIEDFGLAAECAGTIDYEMLTGVSDRVKRVYKC